MLEWQTDGCLIRQASSRVENKSEYLPMSLRMYAVLGEASWACTLHSSNKGCEPEPENASTRAATVKNGRKTYDKDSAQVACANERTLVGGDESPETGQRPSQPVDGIEDNEAERHPEQILCQDDAHVSGARA